MADMAKRFPENPLISPADVKPSRKDYEVIGSFNAGAVMYNDQTILLLRIAERPKNKADNEQVSPILDAKTGKIRLLRVKGDDPDLEVPDARSFYYKNKMYLTCQGIPYLIEIDMSDNSFSKHHDKKNPFGFPLCLCLGNDDTIFITDGETRTVYKFRNGEVKPFITDGLSRPTGISANVEKERLYIVDTGDHDLKIFDFDGKLIKTVSDDLTTDDKFHFPTHVSTTVDNDILVNDALNYKIKRFDSDGHLLSSFGEEGDGPGTFSRPKGVASDSEGNIYVVDNLFDNLQIFDSTGRFLLVIGSVGSQVGQFYSPSGLAITNDTVYIADTYNDRIQILRFLGRPK